MTGMVAFDDTVASTIEAMYTTADVVEQRRVVLELLNPQPGEDVLDIGSGPGFLACEIAQRVGPSGAVHGIDPSTSMLSTAAGRDAGERAAPLHFGTGDALKLHFRTARSTP